LIKKNNNAPVWTEALSQTNLELKFKKQKNSKKPKAADYLAFLG
jgi:hypothetical protein